MTSQLEEEAKLLRKSGLSILDISKRLGVSRFRVGRWVGGAASRPEREEARRLRREGMSVRSIQNKLGVSSSRVSLWVRDITLSEEQRRELDERHLEAVRRQRKRPDVRLPEAPSSADEIPPDIQARIANLEAAAHTRSISPSRSLELVRLVLGYDLTLVPRRFRDYCHSFLSEVRLGKLPSRRGLDKRAFQTDTSLIRELLALASESGRTFRQDKAEDLADLWTRSLRLHDLVTMKRSHVRFCKSARGSYLSEIQRVRRT